MHPALIRVLGLLALLSLGACGPSPTANTPSGTLPGYEAVQDGQFFIQAVEPIHLFGDNPRTEVDYAGPEGPNTIVVDIHSRRLYYVIEGGRAVRYAIAVGREGLSFTGNGTIQRKEEWPSWTPTRNMVRTRPDLYAAYAGGLPGGLENPLGARALYLYRNGRDTYFRIHGTIDNASIGRATSAGCIRLFNQDAIDLYNRVELGTQVVVRSREDSLALEGPFMDDAYGRAVPETPQNLSLRERQLPKVAAQAAEDAAAQGLIVPLPTQG